MHDLKEGCNKLDDALPQILLRNLEAKSSMGKMQQLQSIFTALCRSLVQNGFLGL